MPMPFVNKEFTFTQPDGTQLKVRGTGNQHSAIFETLDGYTVMRDPTSGFYHYARLADNGDALVPSGVRAGSVDPQMLALEIGAKPKLAGMRELAFAVTGLSRAGPTRWEERRNERWLALNTTFWSEGVVPAPQPRGTVGQYVGSCLLIQFPDVQGTITREQVEAFCNKQGYNEFGNNGSVRDYYFDNSDGKLTYTNVVAPYYTAQHQRSYYTAPEMASGVRAQELIKEALAYHVGTGFDFGGLSSDSGNFVYATNAFYAGDVVNNWNEGLWPHSSSLVTPFQLAPSKISRDYQITNMGQELTLGTFCHENGHMICDFPDLYAHYNEWKGVGEFCLMCYGGAASYRHMKNPTQIGAYLKNHAGWRSSLKTLSPGSSVALHAGKNEFAIFCKNATEYFIIENREKAGRDALLPDAGLAVWHVDELGNNFESSQSTSRHRECSLVQADGNRDLEENVNYGDGSDLFRKGLKDEVSDTTTPNARWLDGTTSGLNVKNISMAGANMSFST